MSVELLISTMNQDSYELLVKMNVSSDAVVINQCKKDDIRVFDYNGHSILWVNSKERGLSKSRNLAISYAKADFCVLSDDDEIFVDNYVDIIENAFTKNTEISIFRFKIKGIEREFKKYPVQKYSIGYLNSMKLSSVELAFRRKDIIDKRIKFDELIGAGTENLMGEENAFIFSCLRNHLKISYEPKTISHLHLTESSWFTGFNKEYFLGKGAAFTAMSKTFSIFFIFQFAIRKYKIYSSEIGFLDAIKYMIIGKRRYKSLCAIKKKCI